MTTISENADIAVLQTEMKSVKDTVLRIETKLDTQTSMYVTRTEFMAFKRQYWLSHSLTAVLTAVVTYLVAYFILAKSA